MNYMKTIMAPLLLSACLCAGLITSSLPQSEIDKAWMREHVGYNPAPLHFSNEEDFGAYLKANVPYFNPREKSMFFNDSIYYTIGLENWYFDSVSISWNCVSFGFHQGESQNWNERNTIEVIYRTDRKASKVTKQGKPDWDPKYAGTPGSMAECSWEVNGYSFELCLYGAAETTYGQGDQMKALYEALQIEKHIIE